MASQELSMTKLKFGMHFYSRFQFAFEKSLRMFVCKFRMFVAKFQCLF